MSDPEAIDAAADELYGAPLSEFTAARKRLADALKAAGSKAAASAVNKLPRPAMSAWVVNQLWRAARDDFDALVDAGARVRDGERGALDDQRAALARLRARAATVLTADNHAASPATLQRVATTLQALSALGTWDPDRPGRLIGDRDPPGFDVMLGAVLDTPAPAPRAAPRDAAAPAPRAAPKTDEQAAARKAAADKAARARVRAAEQALLERAVEGQKKLVVQRSADLANARSEVAAAEAALARARTHVKEAEAALATAEERVHEAESALASHLAADADG